MLETHNVPFDLVQSGVYRVYLVDGYYAPAAIVAPPANSQSRRGYLIRCPTDGTNESDTRAKMCKFLGLFFPRAEFFLAFANHPQSEAAEMAYYTMGF